MTSPLIDYLDELIDKIPLLDNVRREGAQQLRNALVNAAAAPDATMTLYRRQDGEDIAGEYSVVGELEYFESDDEPTDLFKELWLKLTTEEIHYVPPGIVDEAPRQSICTACGSVKTSTPDSTFFTARPGEAFDLDWDGCARGSGT
jgi:hypothetical protein